MLSSHAIKPSSHVNRAYCVQLNVQKEQVNSPVVCETVTGRSVLHDLAGAVLRPDQGCELGFARAVEQIEAGRVQPQLSHALTLQSAGTSRTVPLDSIYYIESSNHKVVLRLKDGEFSCYAKIRDLEAELGDQFFRVPSGSAQKSLGAAPPDCRRSQKECRRKKQGAAGTARRS